MDLPQLTHARHRSGTAEHEELHGFDAAPDRHDLPAGAGSFGDHVEAHGLRRFGGAVEVDRAYARGHGREPRRVPAGEEVAAEEGVAQLRQERAAAVGDPLRERRRQVGHGDALRSHPGRSRPACPSRPDRGSPGWRPPRAGGRRRAAGSWARPESRLTRSSGPRPKVSACQRRKWERGACVPRIALGVPVEPEVKAT